MLEALDRKHEADFDHTHVWVGGIPEVSQTLLLTEVRSRCISQSRSGTESTPRKPLGLESLARPTSGHLVGGAGTVFCLASTRSLSSGDCTPSPHWERSPFQLPVLWFPQR